MILSVALNPEEEAELLAQARGMGVPPDALVREAVKKLLLQTSAEGRAEALGPDGLYPEDRQILVRENTPERQRERAQAIAELRERRKGITLGPDTGIKDLVNAGRR